MKNYFKITVFLAIAAFSFEKIQGAAAAEGSGLPTLWDDPEIRCLTLQLSAELSGSSLRYMQCLMGALQKAFVSPDGVIQNQDEVLNTFSTIQALNSRLNFNVETIKCINVLFEKCLNCGLTVITPVFHASGFIPFFEKVIRALDFTNDDYMRLILKHIPDLDTPLSNGKTIIQTVWNNMKRCLERGAMFRGMQEEDESESGIVDIYTINRCQTEIKKSERLIDLLIEEAKRRNQ